MNCRNHQARQPEPMEDDPTVAATLEVDSTDTGSFHNMDPEFQLEARRCHHVQDIVPEHQQRFVNKMKAFKTRWNKGLCRMWNSSPSKKQGQKATRSNSHIWHDSCIWLPHQ